MTLPKEYPYCNQIAALNDKYGLTPEYTKFARNIDHWWKVNKDLMERLGLVKSPPLNILDVGACLGYFGVAARLCGHRVVNLDIPDKPILRDGCAIVGGEWVWHVMRPGLVFPDFLTTWRFHLVTCHCILPGGGWTLGFRRELVTEFVKVLTQDGRLALAVHAYKQSNQVEYAIGQELHEMLLRDFHADEIAERYYVIHRSQVDPEMLERTPE